jgi:hypothetical protein
MHTTVPFMTEKISPAGWVVQVLTPGKPSLIPSASGRLYDLLGPPSFEYFNVAIGAPAKAVEATTKQLAEGRDRETRVVRALSSEEIAALSLKAGQVVPA